MSRLLRARDGIGLVESLISMGIATAGLLAVAGLMAVGTQQMAAARDGGLASRVATSQFERLRMLPQVSAARQIGGALDANVVTHTAVVDDPVSGRVRVRWQITAGPAGTLEVAVIALPENTRSRPATIRGMLWR